MFQIRFITILLSSYYLISCSTGPDFERNNKKDPFSDNFIPDSPNYAKIDMDEDRHIHIQWFYSSNEENSRDGFLIKKKMHNSAKFQVMDTLISDVDVFVDTSAEYSIQTEYLIEAFIIRNDSLITDDVPLLLNIPFSLITFTSLTESGDNLNLQWEFEKDVFYQYQPPNYKTRFMDGLLIELRDKNTNEWVAFDTLYSTELYKTQSSSINKPDFLFYLDSRISAFLLNYKGELEILSTRDFNIYINSIEDFKAEAVNELTLKFNWANKTDKVDGYIISHLEINTPIDTVYGYQDSHEMRYLSYSGHHRFSIQPFNETGKGKSIESNFTEIFVYPPREFNISPINQNEVELSWDYNGHEEKVGGFLIYRKSDTEHNFSVIDTVDSQSRSYIDIPPDKFQSYKYIVSTITSDPSSTIEIRFYETYTPLSIDDNSLNNTTYLTDKRSNSIVGYNENNGLINIYDSNDYNLKHSISLASIQENTGVIYNIALNEDESYIAFVTTSQSSSYWNYKRLHIYDLSIQEYVVKDISTFNSISEIQFSYSEENKIYVSSANSLYELDLGTLNSTELDIPGGVGNHFLVTEDNFILYNYLNGFSYYSFDTESHTTILNSSVQVLAYDHSDKNLYLRTEGGLYILNTTHLSLARFAEDLSSDDLNLFLKIPNSNYFAFHGRYYENSEIRYINKIIDTNSNKIIDISIPSEYLFFYFPYYYQVLPNGNLSVFTRDYFYELTLNEVWSIVAITHPDEFEF